MTNSFKFCSDFFKTWMHFNKYITTLNNSQRKQVKFPYCDQILNLCMLLHTVWKYNTGMKAFLRIQHLGCSWLSTLKSNSSKSYKIRKIETLFLRWFDYLKAIYYVNMILQTKFITSNSSPNWHYMIMLDS